MIAPRRAQDDKDPNLFRRPATRLSHDLREGRLSARGILDHYLERIARLNPALNAFVSLDPTATAGADASDELLRSGRVRSPLEGIPIAVKDNLLLRGCPAVWGSPLYAGYVPDHDELPIRRLRDAGAIFIGKTNVPEFAMRGYTDNSVYGTTRNPWSLDLTPGGSSGGAVAAVAAGLAPLAIATDGGGSIRRPAAHTGLVGLKPSVGRVSRESGFPPLMFDCEVVGPIARTVGGAALMFGCLAQNGRPKADLPGCRRILVVERFGNAPVDAGIVVSTRHAAADLARLGYAVSYGELPFAIDLATNAWRTVTQAGLATLSQQQPRFFEVASDDFVADAKEGAQLTAADYAAAVGTILEFRSVVAQAFDRIDIIMTPATAAQPWPAAEAYPPVIDGQPVGPRGHAIFTAWVNICGHPAIAIPVRPGAAGMPVGIQLIGAHSADENLLDIAEEFEAASPWADRWPVYALR